MIHVVAVLIAQPGQRAELLKAFQANVPAVHAEAGCIEYVATIDAAGVPSSKGSFGADTFVVIEKWESLAALQAHGASPHMQAYAAATKPLVASRMIHILEPA